MDTVWIPQKSWKKAPEIIISKINYEELEEMDIYGFSTSQLLELLTHKAQNDTMKDDVKEEIPELLAHLHEEMEEGKHEVMIHDSISKINYF